ncbi:hypothetical protein HTG_00100 [Natrinema mahii]|nr:hypothetical protein HTG_00100 [Natrinema mahii]
MDMAEIVKVRTPGDDLGLTAVGHYVRSVKSRKVRLHKRDIHSFTLITREFRWRTPIFSASNLFGKISDSDMTLIHCSELVNDCPTTTVTE